MRVASDPDRSYLEEESESRVLDLGGGEGPIRSSGLIATASSILNAPRTLIADVDSTLECVARRRAAEELTVVVVGPAVGLGDAVRIARVLGGGWGLSPVISMRERLDPDATELLLSAGFCDCLETSSSVDAVVRALRLGFEVSRRQRAEALWHDSRATAGAWPPPALLEARRFAMIGRTFLGVAHDLRNLVHPIRGYAEMLAEEPSGTGSQPRFAHSIFHLTDQMEELLRRAVVAVSGQTSPTEVEGDRILAKVESLLRAVSGPRIRVELTLGGGGARIRTPEGALDQIVLNLAVNSQEAMRSGGHLRVVSSASSAHWTVRITDSGSGIPKASQDSLFKADHTSRSPGMGHGLGLWIVQHLVTELGGEIEVRSEEGVGTSVMVRLPRCDLAGPAADVPA